MPPRISESEYEKLFGPAPAKRKAKRPKADPSAERAAFLAMCEANGLPVPTPEFRFCERKWAFDWGWEARKVALEIEGGSWVAGRHNRGAGFQNDMAKYNRATVLGWRVVRATPQQVESGEIFATLRELLS